MLLPGAAFVLWVLRWVFVAVAVFALVHAARQRSEAFTVADKLTKGKWVGITAASAVVIALLGAVDFIGIIAVVAALVYLTDVRPKVEEVQRGPRW
jgi:hypothetical protein